MLVRERYRVHAAKYLGHGSQGTVCRALDEISGVPLAAKLFSAAQAKAGAHEAEVLRRVDGCELVTAYVDFCELVKPSEDGEVSGVVLPPASVLLMEFVTGGDLLARLLAGGAVAELSARSVFADLACAIAHCHSRGIAHRDVKLENVLLDMDGRVKLADFGLAAIVRTRLDEAERLLLDRCGSKAYVAPEVIASSAQPYVGSAVDVWAAGVCLFAMVAAFFPFDIACPQRDWRVPHVLAAQAHGDSSCLVLFALAQRPCPFSQPLLDLLDRMLLFDARARASLDEVLRSAWLQALTDPDAGAWRAPNDAASELASDAAAATAEAQASETCVSGPQEELGAPVEVIVLDDTAGDVFRSVSLSRLDADQPGATTFDDVVTDADVYRSLALAVGLVPSGVSKAVPALCRMPACNGWAALGRDHVL